MELNAKYQYTHFIYPFVVENNKYFNFIQSLIKQERTWNIKIHQAKTDEALYNFFLPYMRKFLFPTLFWNKEYIKQYKSMSVIKKANAVSKLSCTTFEYNLSSIKTGSVSGKQYGAIHFDISHIKLVCFESGICFLDIKTEIDEELEDGTIEFSKVLDFNHYFRNLTPRAISHLSDKSTIKGKNIDNIESIATFIKSVISGFETTDLEKIYYDKMFTYSYACVDGWDKESDFAKIENEFYKFQYVVDSKSSSLFNKDCARLKQDRYSRWQYSMFGFSRESGVVFVSDKEKYNITRMPYNFEKTYLYMLFLAFYQRISLINFSQDLMKKDKTRVKKLKSEFTKFTHFSWFSQITNSEHGMDIWKRWQSAFELPELFEEVQKEYLEYYDFVVASGQEKINVLLIILYTVSVIFAGLQILTNLFNLHGMKDYIIVTMIATALSYPIFVALRWIKHKIEALSR
ncbi:MAG: hypothetical protein RSE00_00575 [Clostridia bacterium]